jgi:hypothetical protein
MSAAVREGVRNLAGWTVTLWLTTPDGLHRGGVHLAGAIPYGKATSSGLAGPMCGVVEVTDLDADWFKFHRPNRAAVRLHYSQVAMWQALRPPPALLPVQEIPR